MIPFLSETFGPTADMEGFLDIDVVVWEALLPSVQASEFGRFRRRRKRYHTPHMMMSRPRAPNNEPSEMATMGLDLGVGDGVALAVEEAMMGTGKVELEDVGNRVEEVEELTFVAVV